MVNSPYKRNLSPLLHTTHESKVQYRNFTTIASTLIKEISLIVETGLLFLFPLYMPFLHFPISEEVATHYGYFLQQYLITVYKNMNEIIRFFGYNYETVRRNRLSKITEIENKFNVKIIIKKQSEFTAIVAYNHITKETIYGSSCESLSKQLGISPNTIGALIKHKRKIIYKDYSFAYANKKDTRI